MSLGGDLVRITPTVKYAAPGGDAEMLGLYFADAGQHFEHRLLVDHSQPHCKSNVVYKGALQGDPESGKPDAHTVWIGDVLIRAEAEGTDTFELNRNLVLTDGARADSVPNLEIETGEIVGAGHASATGRFDDEQLFYLRARGIPEDQPGGWSCVASSTRSSIASPSPRCASVSRPLSRPSWPRSAPDPVRRPYTDTSPIPA